MKIIIAYMSETGNTKKIAEAIFQEIQEEKEIKELNQIDDLESCDLVFVGFPLHGYGAPEEVKGFLEKFCMGKKIALFVTHGAPEDSEELQPWLAGMSAVVRLLIYLVCIGALPHLRRKYANAAGQKRLPGGWTLPIISIAVCVWLLTQITLNGALVTAAFLAIGGVLYLWRKQHTTTATKSD